MPEATSTRSGVWGGGQGGLELLSRQAVPTKATGDQGHGCRLVDGRLDQLARAIGVRARHTGVRGQAVDDRDAVPTVTQGSGNRQQPQRLDPGVVAAKS